MFQSFHINETKNKTLFLLPNIFLTLVLLWFLFVVLLIEVEEKNEVHN